MPEPVKRRESKSSVASLINSEEYIEIKTEIVKDDENDSLSGMKQGIGLEMRKSKGSFHFVSNLKDFKLDSRRASKSLLNTNIKSNKLVSHIQPINYLS